MIGIKLQILEGHKEKMSPENYNSIELALKSGAVKDIKELLELINICTSNNNNTQTVSEPQREETETPEDNSINIEDEGSEEFSDWDCLEDIEEQTQALFNVLLSMDENIMHNDKIDYTGYCLLKSLSEFDPIQKDGFTVGVDTVNLKINTLEDIGKKLKTQKGYASRNTMREILKTLEENNIITIVKNGNRYQELLINKVQKGEKGIMLTNRTIQGLSSVLKSDALKVYMYLLSKKLYFNKTKRPFIVSAATISKGALGKGDTKTDKERIYKIIDGLRALDLADIKTKSDPKNNTRVYKIEYIKMPKNIN